MPAQRSRNSRQGPQIKAVGHRAGERMDAVPVLIHAGPSTHPPPYGHSAALLRPRWAARRVGRGERRRRGSTSPLLRWSLLWFFAPAARPVTGVACRACGRERISRLYALWNAVVKLTKAEAAEYIEDLIAYRGRGGIGTTSSRPQSKIRSLRRFGARHLSSPEG